MLACRDEQDIADSRQHENGQWIVDHRLVVVCQKLLVDGEGRRIKPSARATGENNALHGMSLLLSKRLIVSPRACRHGRGSMPKSRRTAAQSSLVSAARTADVAYSLVPIGTICGDRPSRSAAISTIAFANSNQLASPAPAK